MATANPVEVEIEQPNFYDNVKEYNFTNCKYSLLIVGPCGAGKSAFCNFLLKDKKFKEAIGILAGTEKADYCTIPFKEGDMLVVDCPGFCDPKRSHEDIMKEISKAAILCRDGMDAVGIVVDPTSRFTETQKISYEMIDSVGGNFWKHAFIIFNREKKLEKNFGSANDYIQQVTKDAKCPTEFKELLNKVNNRYICVESTKRCDDEAYWGMKRDNLLAMIMQIKEYNAGGVYMNSFMNCGQITYKSLVELMEKMQERMEKQDLHIQELEKGRAAEKSQIAELKASFMERVVGYEITIKNILEKGAKQSKKCSLM